MIDFLGVYHSKMVNDVISYPLESIVPVCHSSSRDFKDLLDFYEIWDECRLTRGRCTSEGFNLSVYLFRFLCVPV